MGKIGEPPRGTKGVGLLVEKLNKNGENKKKKFFLAAIIFYLILKR
jgi:hypothetical protein